MHGLFTRYQLHNRLLWGAMGLSLLCVCLIIYSPINQYFASGPLGFTDWLYALLAAIIFLAVREVYFRHRNHTQRHTRAHLFATHHPNTLRRHLTPR
jgi:magnesium-transporting ATPase (P-type)